MLDSFFSENNICTIQDIQVTIQSHIGHISGIDYFQVLITSEISELSSDKLGLLRIGSSDQGLSRELKLRETLGQQKFLAPLLALEKKSQNKVDHLEYNFSEIIKKTESENIDSQDNSDLPINDTNLTIESELQSTEIYSDEQKESNDSQTIQILSSPENSYLEEEFYPEKQLGLQEHTEILFLLTAFPLPENTLKTCLKHEQSMESSLLLASQICQLFRLIHQHNWCVISILTEFVQIGTPLQFFDLTGAYPIGTTLDYGLMGKYYPPELSYGDSLQESMSTYLVGTLLYQSLFKDKSLELLELETDLTQEFNFEIPLFPKIYQILKIALSSVPSDRFSLLQLLNILIETRRSLKLAKVNWETAIQSTVGLSLNRLHNEDSYGIKEQHSSNHETIILAVIADGMGGMSQGEVASQLAVTTILNSSIPDDLNNPHKIELWLMNIVENANEIVSKNVNNGGTTLSIVASFGKRLHIAHVGDSRILLLRKGIICQLTEDHSMVKMLLSSGQISYKESLEHPDRNILVKSLGSKPKLSQGYVQTLSHITPDSFLELEAEDLLILCSDGIWDLISEEYLVNTLNSASTLQSAVNTIIEETVTRGANDNATLLVLRISIASATL